MEVYSEDPPNLPDLEVRGIPGMPEHWRDAFLLRMFSRTCRSWTTRLASGLS